MSKDFLSIWLELKREKERDIMIGGFYREWASGD